MLDMRHNVPILTSMPATSARRNKENDMNVYRIEYKGQSFYVNASSAKAAMLKHFGVEKMEGATIVKSGEQ